MAATALTIYVEDGEPRVLDTALAAELGYARPEDIRKLIARHEATLVTMGTLPATMAGSNGGRPARERRLNKAQALFIIIKAETAKAVEVTVAVIEKFLAYEAGLIQASPAFAVPQTMPEALRLAADAWEAKALADQRAALAETKVAELTPMATVGMLAANSDHSLMTVLRGLPYVNSNKVMGTLADIGILRRVPRGKFRVNRSDYGKHFLEGIPDNFGGVIITPTAKGRMLLARLYREGRLPMLKGQKPQRMLKAIGAA